MNSSLETSIIFDINGTLVESYDFDSLCYMEAVRDVLGEVAIHDSWEKYNHVTDSGILQQIIEENELNNAAGLIAEVRGVFGAKIRRYIDDGGTCELVPGAPEALARLVKDGFKVGLSTGGWRHMARMKLQRAGIPIDSLPLTSSDDDVDRVRIMEKCLNRLGGYPQRAIYVGDGIWDLKASANAGCAFIGVGERLKGFCSQWVRDFLDPAWGITVERALKRMQ